MKVLFSPVFLLVMAVACSKSSGTISEVASQPGSSNLCEITQASQSLPDGISVTRCVSKIVPHRSNPELNRLQVVYTSRVDRSVGRHTLALGGKPLFVFVKLNGQEEKSVPMACDLQTGDDSSCVVTLFSNDSSVNVDASQGIQVLPDLFKFARNNNFVNAWDIEVAFTDGQGHWDSLNGANYKVRFDEVKASL